MQRMEVRRMEWRVSEGVVHVLLDAPPMNVLDEGFLEQFLSLLDRVESSNDVGCILFQPQQNTRAFSAGADIAFIEECAVDHAGVDRMLAFVERLQEAFSRLEASDVPSVAALGAVATGGGFELALACDLRVAGDSVRLGLPEVRIGLLPGAGGTQRLSRLCGKGLALDLVLTGRLVTGREAQTLGLVQRSVPDASVIAEATALARQIASAPRETSRWIKRCIAASSGKSGFAMELEATRSLLCKPQTQHLIKQFINQRARRHST